MLLLPVLALFVRVVCARCMLSAEFMCIDGHVTLDVSVALSAAMTAKKRGTNGHWGRWTFLYFVGPPTRLFLVR